MALSRKAKIWLVILGLPVVLLAGTALALKLYFTSERLKAFIVPEVETTMKRKVVLNDISLSVFPSIAIEIDGLQISNKEGEGFSDQPMISLDKLVLDVRIGALFKGNLEVTTVVLEQPRIFLEVNKQGMPNYSEGAVTGKEAEAPAPSPGVAKGGALLLSNFKVVNGSFAYVNHKFNSATRIDGLNQQLRIEFLPASQEARIESQSSVDNFSYGSVTTPLVSQLRLTSKQNLIYHTDSDLLTIEQGNATIQDIVLAVRGTVSKVTTESIMDLAIESDNVNIAELLSLAPKEYMKKAEGVKGSGTAQIKIEIKGVVTDTTNPDITGTVTVNDASIQYNQLPKPITNIGIVASFARTKAKQEFRMPKFSAQLGGNPLNGSMAVVNFEDPSLTLDMNASLNLAEVKDYYPVEEGTELTGALKANVSIAGKVSNPQAMKASGAMEFRGVTIKTAASKNPLQNLNGTVTFNNQIVEAKKLSMNLGKSDLSLAFWMKNYLSMVSEEQGDPKPTANLTLTSNHLYTADIMSDEQATGQPASKSGGEARGGVPLPNVDMDVSATIGMLTMEKFELKDVRGSMKIGNGIVTMQNFSFDAYGGTFITKGVLNMQAPERPAFDLALDVNGADAHTMLPQFTNFGERMFGKLTMNTTLKGVLDDTLGLVPQALNGKGGVQVENGKLTGVEVNKAVAGFLNLPDLREINFRDWSNSFSIMDGRIHIKDLKISALDADYIVNGSQGLDGTLDYSMSLLLPEKTSAKISVPGFAGQAVNLFKDESGRVKLDFAVSGTSDNPKVALNTDAAKKKAEDLAKQKVAEEAKKLEDQVKKKGEDLLKDLFKKKK